MRAYKAFSKINGKLICNPNGNTFEYEIGKRYTHKGPKKFHSTQEYLTKHAAREREARAAGKRKRRTV